MPEINEPDVGRELARRFQIKGRSIVPSLSPEIVPTIITDDLRDLKAQPGLLRTAWGGAFIAAGAGVFGHVQLNLVGTLNVIFELEAVFAYSVTAASVISLRIGNTAAATTTPEWRDRRLAGNPEGTLTAFTNAAVQGTEILRFSVPADVTYTLAFKAIMRPEAGGVNSALILAQTTVNQQLQGNFVWTERDPFPGELD